jgi:adenine-specific DNA-methyltransferase
LDKTTLPIIEHIEKLLKKSDKFIDKDKNLYIAKILEAIDKIDESLISLLIKDDKAKKMFFIKVQDIYVLKQNDLIDFFTMNEYFKGSFTAYKNIVSLIRKDDFINKFDDVVLAFPHKDCVLEGGQTKDEDKSNENFHNNILHHDEIDRLLEPKVLTNIKRFDKDGEHTIDEIKEDDNLIIKGNNLLALHSLKDKYQGKVKLIYIDPPYNTGSDSFKYNDNFNHSTWLTFMKNRLEIAKEFLSDDGVIFVQCDDNEQAYLKVLMDEIFGRNNFINCLVPEMSNMSGNKVEHAIQGRKFPKIKEYILLYVKNKNNYSLHIPKQTKSKWDNEYNIILPHLTKEDYLNIDTYIIKNEIKNLNNLLKVHKIESLTEYIKINNIENIEQWKILNSYKILASKPNTALKKKASLINFNNQIEAIHNSRGNVKIIRTDFNRKTDTARIELVFAKKNIEVFFGDIWFKIITTGGVALEGDANFKNGKKPEQLLEIILKSSTKPNDLVLDFHLGSGTTCAVAHKMGRRYIGIEQMDYIEDISVERMKKVIKGENGGISKAVEWNGGGSFVYAELKEIDNFKESKIEKLNQVMKYLPIDEIDDETYKISKNEIKINKKFYGVDDE